MLESDQLYKKYILILNIKAIRKFWQTKLRTIII